MKIVLSSFALAATAISAFQMPSARAPTTSSALSVLSEEVSTEEEVGSNGPVGMKDEIRPHATPKSFATKCASLYHPHRGAERGLAPPVYFGSTFLLDDAAHGARLHEKREAPYTDEDGFVYSRWGAPTNEAAALQIAALEGVEEGTGKCLLFNSGMSAITSSLMAVLKAGDHAIFPFCTYGGTLEFMKEFATHWGIDVTFVDAAGPEGPENYRKAFRENTRVVYAETPANPTCRLTDLAGVAKAVDEHYGPALDIPGTDVTDRKRPWIMVDGTFATPYHQRVLDIPGVDIAMQSATKYLGGHSDILAGSVTSRSEPFLHACSKVQKLITVPLNPMDSFLLARGLRTLDVRMQRHGENAIKVARMLEAHPMVAEVVGRQCNNAKRLSTKFCDSHYFFSVFAVLPWSRLAPR